jgi:hypothetical protein
MLQQKRTSLQYLRSSIQYENGYIAEINTNWKILSPGSSGVTHQLLIGKLVPIDHLEGHIYGPCHPTETNISFEEKNPIYFNLK